jgi:hypothetical protein
LVILGNFSQFCKDRVKIDQNVIKRLGLKFFSASFLFYAFLKDCIKGPFIHTTVLWQNDPKRFKNRLNVQFTTQTQTSESGITVQDTQKWHSYKNMQIVASFQRDLKF